MDASQFQRIAKALADPRRFEIFQEMAKATDELNEFDSEAVAARP